MKNRDIGIIGGLALVMFISMLIFSHSYGNQAPKQTQIILSSEDFDNNNPIPDQLTCTGSNTSPQLNWSNIPPGTKSFALVCHDPDAPGGDWIHWIVFNIPANVTSFQRRINEKDFGYLQGVNSFGETGYRGPCPPINHGKHHYIFTIYALDSMLSIPQKIINLRGNSVTGVSHNMLQKAIFSKILGKGILVGTYERKSYNAPAMRVA